jgi:acrylyl-CoA reductase (NADPH)
MTVIRAVVTTGEGPATVQELSEEDLPAGDVTVDVAYSSLNYKDGLAVTGRGRIARSFPMVCGIDLAGTVSASESPDWAVGDEVVVTGWGLSETRPGGYTTRQRVTSSMPVRRPAGLSAARSMAVGTAGLTAALCVLALEDAGVAPGDGDVVVTGPAGGVGGVAVALLAGAGYRVVAATGRPGTHEYLTALGASDFVARTDLAVEPGRPLEKERWAGAVDTVGSTTLASVIRQTRYGGAVTACGLAGGNDLPVTVLPFILRGVRLVGVDSVSCPTPLRIRAWDRLATSLPVDVLDSLSSTEAMSDLPRLAEDILAGRTRGRVVIDVAR